MSNFNNSWLFGGPTDKFLKALDAMNNTNKAFEAFNKTNNMVDVFKSMQKIPPSVSSILTSFNTIEAIAKFIPQDKERSAMDALLGNYLGKIDHITKVTKQLSTQISPTEFDILSKILQETNGGIEDVKSKLKETDLKDLEKIDAYLDELFPLMKDRDQLISQINDLNI